jgi:16S rRNA (uracil1498-N3)-methyltransferase
MKLHRFIGDFDLSAPALTIRDREIAHQIKDVLRLRIEERLILVDTQGQAALCEIVDFVDDQPVVRVIEHLVSRAEPNRRVGLYCAILKRENFELVVQKATELGVSEIVPIITARTVKLGLKMDRLRKIATEAAEQSGRVEVPTIFEPQNFHAALRDAARHKKIIMLDPLGPERLGMIQGTSVAVFVGPEGGWTKDELSQAREVGGELMNLGTLVLRGETAAMVAVDRLAWG